MRLIQEYGALLRYRKEMRIWQGSWDRTYRRRKAVCHLVQRRNNRATRKLLCLAESCDDGVHFADLLPLLKTATHHDVLTPACG